MRIGVDARNLIGGITGISRYVLESCRSLSGMGHEVILYLPERQNHNLLLPGVVRATTSFRGGILRTVWGQTKLPQMAHNDRLDVFWGPAHRLPSLLHKAIPTVVTIHDLVWRHAASTMKLQGFLGEMCLMGPAISRATRIVAVSNATAASIGNDYSKSKEKIRVVYPGLTPFPDPKSQLSELGIEQPFILFVGTLEPRKNLANLLEAYSLLPLAVREKLSLVIAGGRGWKVDHLSHLDRLGIKESVKIVGYVTDDQLARLYKDAEFLAMISIYEGFGLPIIEANSMGTPAIVSTNSSLPETAADAAILVDATSAKEVSLALHRLWTDRALREQLSLNAFANAKRFDWQKTAAGLTEVFHEAIGNHTAS